MIPKLKKFFTPIFLVFMISAGFGLGFERAIMYFSGMANIRDVIPFPRTPKNAEF